MNSKITIEINFDNGNEPVIQIIFRNSDDVRDKLIKSFLERLGGDSSWCKIFCDEGRSESGADKFQRWKIYPINAAQFKEEGAVMLEQSRIIDEFQRTGTITYGK